MPVLTSWPENVRVFAIEMDSSEKSMGAGWKISTEATVWLLDGLLSQIWFIQQY